jgi:hypothetical protein
MAVLSSPALANLDDPLTADGSDQPPSVDLGTEIVSQGMQSATGEIFSQGMMAQSGPWAGEVYSQGVRMVTGQIYSQGTAITMPSSATYSQPIWGSPDNPISPLAGPSNPVGISQVLGRSTFVVAASPVRDPIPEPASWALLAGALLWFALAERSRKRV